MKIRIVVIFLILVGTFTTQGQIKKWSLRECIEHAVKNNISVKQSQLDVAFTDIDKLDAIGSFLPSLNLDGTLASNTGANINPTTNLFETQTFTSLTLGAQAGVRLYDGLRNFRQLQRAKIAKIASQYSLEKMEDDIALNVANGYLQVLTARESLKVINAQHEVTLQELERTKELVDAGVLPAGDMLEVKATSADESRRIILAENTIQIALISLAQTLVLDDYKNFDIEDRDYEVPVENIMQKSIEDIIASSKEKRYEVKIAEENTMLAAKDLEVSKGAYQPTLDGFFRYNTRWTDNDFFERGFTQQLYESDGFSYGLQLNVPIFNGFSSRNAVKRSKINLKRAEYQLEQAKLDLENTVYQVYTDARGAAKAYEAALVAENARKQAHQFAKDRYDVGLINAFDFSQAKLRLENAQSELVRTKFDYIFKLKVLELYFGIPVEELKL